MASCCRNGFRREVCELYEHLLKNSTHYFDRNDVLNSDGRRLLEVLVRMLLDEAPWLRRLVYIVRREPTLDKILRLGEEFYACDPYQLLSGRLGLNPYL